MVVYCGEEEPKKPPIKDVKTKTKSEKRQPQPILEFPHFLRIIGPKHIKIMMHFVPSAVFYGLTSLLLVTYVADWKTVLQYLPYYNGKYRKETAESKEKEDED